MQNKFKNLIILIVTVIILIHNLNAQNDETKGSASKLEDRRFASFIDIGSTVYYQSLCLIAETTQIKMQCTSNDKIKILRSVYGYNPDYKYMSNANLESCAFSIKDCNFDREYTIDNDCTGKNTCLITIKKTKILNESLAFAQTCKDFNYVQINYQCLPNLPTKDICAVSQSELSHAYIMSPSLTYTKLTGGFECDCTLTSSYENGQILLRRVDMKLPNDKDNEACNGAYLEILENDKRTERKCGYVREAGSIFGSGAKKLKLSFVNNQNQMASNEYGFWLEILASPPKENHNIEIKCNKRAGFVYPGSGNVANNEEIVDEANIKKLFPNSQIFKKIKLIQEKLKRLNKTISDPKLSNNKLSKNNTQLFLWKTNKKFLNVSNSLSVLGKKLFDENFDFKITNIKTEKPKSDAKTTHATNLALTTQRPTKKSKNENIDELKEEINSFLSDKEPLSNKIDELEMFEKKLNYLKNKLKETDDKLDLKQPISINEKKTPVKKKKPSKGESKIDLSSSKVLKTENLKEKKKPPQEEEPLKEEEEWIKMLDSLNEELDLGEKIITNKEPVIEPKEEIMTEATTVPIPLNNKDSPLAELIKEHYESKIAHSISKSNNNVSNNGVVLNAQMQHLSNNNETQSNSTDYIADGFTKQVNFSGIVSLLAAQHPKLNKKHHTIIRRQTKKLLQKDMYVDNLIKLLKIKKITGQTSNNQTTTTPSIQNLSTSTLTNSFTNQINISKISCQKNLTKLTMFYTNIDKLSCVELTHNKSILKCNDDILEKKIVSKLGKFYYVQLKPLIVGKNKMNCPSDHNETTTTIKKFFKEDLDYISSNEEINSLTSSNSFEYLIDDAENFKLSNQTITNSTHNSSSYFISKNEKDTMTNSINKLTCYFLTKKSTNRKKLVWKLQLILKNQKSCIHNFFKKLEIKNLDANKTTKKKVTNNGSSLYPIVIKLHLDNSTQFNTTESEFINFEEYYNEDGENINLTSQEDMSDLTPNFSNALFSSNKIILIVLIACSICFILMTNTLLYVIFKKRKNSSSTVAGSSFSMSMSMNNRLLQNYLDLSVHSENNRNDTMNSSSVPKASAKQINTNNQKETPMAKPDPQYINQINNLTHELTNQTLTTTLTNEEELNLKNKSKKSPEKTNVAVNKILKSNQNNNLKLESYNKKETVEISRIPSLKRNKYSVCTVATQADMDKGSIIAERKDYKYRNQDYTDDVESQILSIEVDLCSDIYATIAADWYNNSNKFFNNLNQSFNSASNDKFITARNELASVTVNDYMAFQNCLNFQLEATNKQKELSKDLVLSKNNTTTPKNRMIVRISSISSSRSSFNKKFTNTKLVAPYKQFRTNLDEAKQQAPPFFSLKNSDDKNIKINLLKQADVDDKNENKIPNIMYEAYKAALIAANKRASSVSSKSSYSLVSSSSVSSFEHNRSFPNNLYMYLDSISNLKSYINSMPENELDKEYVEKLLKIGPNEMFKKKIKLVSSSFSSSTNSLLLNNNNNCNKSENDESFENCYWINKEKFELNNKTDASSETSDDSEDCKNEADVYSDDYLTVEKKRKKSLPFIDPNIIYSQVELSENSDTSSSNADDNYTKSSETSSSSSIKTSESLTSSSASSLESTKKQPATANPLNKKLKINQNSDQSCILSSSSAELAKELASFNLNPNSCVVTFARLNNDDNKTTTVSTPSKPKSFIKDFKFFGKKEKSETKEILPNTILKRPNDASLPKSKESIDTYKETRKIDISSLNRAERIKVMLEQEKLALEKAKKEFEPNLKIADDMVEIKHPDSNLNKSIENDCYQTEYSTENLMYEKANTDDDSDTPNQSNNNTNNNNKNVRFADNVSYI